MVQTYQEIFSELKTVELAFLVASGLLFIIRLLYLFLFTGRILFIKKQEKAPLGKNAVSLILTVRNEENNLRENLPKILTIENVDYEVVVVDDFSQDSTFLVLGLLKKDYDRLKISSLNEETRFSMKLAQNIAIKAAKNDWILGIPVTFENNGTAWLSGFISEIGNEKDVIAGYCNTLTTKGFYTALYRAENIFSFAKSTAYILNNLPFVYTDENVAFRKNRYFEVGGYSQMIREPFANLELIINSFISKQKTSVLFNGETSIRKPVVAKWKDYLDLLNKQIRIEKHLSITKQTILAFDELTKLLFLPVVITTIALLPELWILFGAVLLVQATSYLLIIKSLQNRLKERKIFISSLVYDFFMSYFKLVYRWYFNRKNRHNKWKRKI